MNSFLEKLNERTYYRRTWLRYKLAYARALWKNGLRPKKTILFYPQMPLAYHILYPICHTLGYAMTTNPNAKFDLAMAFEDVTTRSKNATLDDLSKRYRVLNSACGDIGKERVDKIFSESFGYGLTIDPRTYQGAYVKKTNVNALHLAEILNAPSEPEKGFVYQKLIDTTTGDHSVTDIRTFIFGNDIPFTLYRKHSADDRFKDDTIVAARVETDAAFTKGEQAAIIRFCKTFGLDYGELDILRDNTDGKIYIVDVNNTPSGPRSGIHMKKDEYKNFLGELCHAFESMVVTETAGVASGVPYQGLAA